MLMLATSGMEEDQAAARLLTLMSAWLKEKWSLLQAVVEWLPGRSAAGVSRW
jgi:hypothetical protein